MTGLICSNLERNTEGFSLDLIWPYGGSRMGELGHRACKSLPEVFALLRGAWASTVEESREDFERPSEETVAAADGLPPGTVIAVSIKRLGDGEGAVVFVPSPVSEAPQQHAPRSFAELLAVLQDTIQLLAEGSPKTWPKTVAEAVTQLAESLDPQVKEQVLEFGDGGKLVLFHHSLGRAIRNNFGLWQDNDALLADCGVDHPDNASSVILRALYAHLKETS